MTTPVGTPGRAASPAVVIGLMGLLIEITNRVEFNAEGGV
jgi:hypothetical protein